MKVLGRGRDSKALTVNAISVAEPRRTKIAAAGGKAEVLAVRRRKTRCHKGVMLESLKNIFSVADLRKRVLFTLGLPCRVRVGGTYRHPGSIPRRWRCSSTRPRTRCSALRHVSGQNRSQMTIFALGIMPYISASIILQLLTVVWPYLERISKEGELGRRKITQYTRYGTIVLSVVQALGIAYFLERNTGIAGGLPLVYDPGWGFRMLTVLTLTTGSIFVMWLGEQITERGIGNGMSLIIFAGIVVGLPAAVLTTLEQLKTGQMGLLRLVALVILMFAVIAAIVFVERGHRRVTVQYAKRVVWAARNVWRVEHAHPMKVNTGGVIPVIFASSILEFPATFAPVIARGGELQLAPQSAEQIAAGDALHDLLYVAGIIFLCYFYTAIIFNPDDVAENMRKYGGVHSGRAGQANSRVHRHEYDRITLVGAI